MRGRLKAQFGRDRCAKVHTCIIAGYNNKWSEIENTPPHRDHAEAEIDKKEGSHGIAFVTSGYQEMIG